MANKKAEARKADDIWKSICSWRVYRRTVEPRVFSSRESRQHKNFKFEIHLHYLIHTMRHGQKPDLRYHYRLCKYSNFLPVFFLRYWIYLLFERSGFLVRKVVIPYWRFRSHSYANEDFCSRIIFSVVILWQLRIPI